MEDVLPRRGGQWFLGEAVQGRYRFGHHVLVVRILGMEPHVEEDRLRLAQLLVEAAHLAPGRHRVVARRIGPDLDDEDVAIPA
jgi:hypothetical protein